MTNSLSRNQIVIIGAAVLIMVHVRRRWRSHRVLHLVSDAMGNESLILSASLAGVRTLFMIDTAYAGAPVVSETFAAVQRRCAWGSIESRYRRCMALSSMSVSRDDRNAALGRELLRGPSRCRSFTSGCTMRLMGIGETVENQADMLLCPAIILDGKRDDGNIDADIVVTNPLQGSPHIITMDYILHRAPCVILPQAGCIYFKLPISMDVSMRSTFSFHRVRLVGGAFSIKVYVGGSALDLVVDTGASTTVSISSTSLEKIGSCRRHDEANGRSVVQIGVNGEHVCSNVISSSVRVGDIDFGEVDVLANSMPVQGSDGYVGMGLLRALDLWLEPGSLGVRRSGLPVRTISATRPHACTGKTSPMPSACVSTATDVSGQSDNPSKPGGIR